MRRRGLSLVELLVAILIIVILAVLLFPAFQKARVAALQSMAISNVRQIGIGITLYAMDWQDHYPRNDGCYPRSSINPDLNANDFPANGIGPGCTVPPFKYRLNHFSWQKWIRPYLRKRQVLEHPLREKDPGIWAFHGELVGGFVLNTAITGQLDTYNRPPWFPRQYRNSWLGGMLTSVPNPSSAMLVLEFPTGLTPMLPGGTVDPGDVSETVYPTAIREFWRYKLYDGKVEDCIAGTKGTRPDPRKVVSGGLTLGFCDTSAKFMKAEEFLARTPTKKEYLGVTGTHTTGWTFQNDCVQANVGNYGFVQPNVEIDYPLWGLEKP